jgi:hypothetical protein
MKAATFDDTENINKENSNQESIAKGETTKMEDSHQRQIFRATQIDLSACANLMSLPPVQPSIMTPKIRMKNAPPNSRIQTAAKQDMTSTNNNTRTLNTPFSKTVTRTGTRGDTIFGVFGTGNAFGASDKSLTSRLRDSMGRGREDEDDDDEELEFSVAVQ